jgi:hypothetical protein
MPLLMSRVSKYGPRGHTHPGLGPPENTWGPGTHPYSQRHPTRLLDRGDCTVHNHVT